MHTYEMILFTNNLAANCAALADGVAGETCTYAGMLHNSPIPAVVQEVASWRCTGYLSSVECYANGAYNVHVRDEHDKHVGFVRVRPVLALAA